MAKTFSSGAALSVVSVLVNPLLEVIASLALGSLLGLAYTYVERFFHSRSKRLCVACVWAKPSTVQNKNSGADRRASMLNHSGMHPVNSKK